MCESTHEDATLPTLQNGNSDEELERVLDLSFLTKLYMLNSHLHSNCLRKHNPNLTQDGDQHGGGQHCA